MVADPNHIKAWREHRGMTQSDLADAVKTTAGMISLLERGERTLSDRWLNKIATALQVTRGTLLDRGPGPTAEIFELWDHLDNAGRRAVIRVARGLAEDAAEYRPPEANGNGDN